jgi:hypothetical protein
MNVRGNTRIDHSSLRSNSFFKYKLTGRVSIIQTYFMEAGGKSAIPTALR